MSAPSHRFPGVEPATRAFLESLASAGGKPIEQLPHAEARLVLVGAQAGVKLTLPRADVTEKTITADGHSIRLFIVRPAGITKPLPAFMFFHGGGWVLGDFPTHERFVRDLVDGSGAAAIFVDYSRSPEAKYPTAIREASAATTWAAEHGAELNLDTSRLAVVGNSVGGNIAAAVALMTKEQGGPALTFQLLFWPVTSAAMDTPSYTQFAEGHFLTRNMMRWFWDCYTTDPAHRRDFHASPLNATSAQLQGLPPTLIQTAGCDVLRDEGNAYGRNLADAGVPVTCTQYNGLIHDYGLLNALSTVPAVRAAFRQACAELRHHLKV